ncbi:MAG: rhomboid family intramembrane serine protease [Arenicella sp.]|nr:rhomboid family intramembrane serine protease [Arenicella sp.]
MPLILVGLMIAVFLIEVIIPGDLSWLGIRPRSISGLLGILLSPFLHADIFHLFANAVPLVVMGAMLNALDQRLYLYRTCLLIVGSGLLTWLISSSGVVIGASGLAFAYWAYLIVNGVRTKKVKDIVISLLTIIIYGTLLISLFRHAPGVSWAGHFSGAIAGGLLAWYGQPKPSV